MAALIVPAASPVVFAGAAGASVVSGTVTDTNNCAISLVPALSPPSTGTASLTIATDASPENSAGQPLTLSQTTVNATLPAAQLQGLVQTGLVHLPLTIPETVTLVVGGSNTTEGIHTYTASATSTLTAVDGIAQPLVTAVTMSDTTWHRVNPTDVVTFREVSAKLVLDVDVTPILGFVLSAAFQCTPSTTSPIITLDRSALGAPSAPRAVSPIPGDGSATVSFVAPANNGGSAITGYVVTGYIGYFPARRQAFTGSATTLQVTALVNARQYRFKVAAVNALGTGAQSSASAAAIVVGAPTAPIMGGAEASRGRLDLLWGWDPPASNNENGAPTTRFALTLFVNGFAQAPRTIPNVGSRLKQTSILGVPAGKQYSFKVAAVNARGQGPWSVVSNTVTSQ